MQRFPRSAIRSHSVGAEWPEFLGTVQLGESFIVETERDDSVNGPIRIAGVEAGQPVVACIEAITMVGPFRSAADPFDRDAGDVELEFRDSCFYFPRNFRVQANPSVGNIGVLPEPTPATLASVREALARGDSAGWRTLFHTRRGSHCHQDCPWVSEGARVHLRAQVDGAGLCLADVHGYRPEGRLSYSGIEVAANVQLRVELSQGWLVEWPLIETEDKIMVVVTPPARVDQTEADRLAYVALRKLVQAYTGSDEARANALVATAAELQACAGPAPTPGSSNDAANYAVVAALPKDALPGR